VLIVEVIRDPEEMSWWYSPREETKKTAKKQEEKLSLEEL
jgi:hypothetical protein